LARWRESPGGPQKSRQFERKIDAQHFLTSIEHSKLAGTYVDPAKGKITLKGYSLAWLERMTPTWRPATATLVEGNLRNHVLGAPIGRQPIGAIRRSDVEAWASALKLAPGTVATVRQHLGQVLTAAVDDGLIPRNPALGARLPRLEAKRARPVDRVTIEALAAAAPDWFVIAIALGVGLGLRQAEATGLTVDRVDFLRRTVRIDRQLVTASSTASLEPPKTASSFRTIPLPTFVGDALAAHLAEHGTGEHGLILHSPGGSPVLRNTFGRVWRDMRTDATVFHDLRHTFASTLLSNGVSIKAVADWMGHANATVTLKTYAHLMPVDEDRARGILDRAFSAEDQLRTGTD
jgi:integrase